MRTPRIVVVGSVNVDLVTRSERLPQPGETIQGTAFSMVLGGKGANQAIAAARLGADVTLMGCVGNDSFGAYARETLAAESGLDLSHLAQSVANPSGIASIAIDSAGQNAITIVAGANADVSARVIAEKAALLAGCDVLMLQGEVPMEANLAAARLVRGVGGIVILDPAPVPDGGFSPEMIGLADFITPNETEAKALTGIAVTDSASARAAAAQLMGRGARGCIVKMGRQGAIALDSTGFSQHVPAFDVVAVDTVAAGDSFNAGFAVGIGRRISLGEALTLAAASGALATTRPGASAAAPTAAEVAALMGDRQNRARIA